MPYLTYDEFKELSSKEVDKEEFDQVLPKASAVLDNVTSHFYVTHDMDDDNSWRVDQFKKALAAQIEYFNILGATTSEEINSQPQTFSAGRTSVSNASNYKVTGTNERKTLVADDVFIFLEGTGLLYAGVAVW